MPDISFDEPIVVCEGTPSPGPRHNAGLPSVVSCPDSSLLLAHRIGTHKNSHDGTQLLWRSRDHGKTWASTHFPFQTAPDGSQAELRTAALSNLGDSRLAMLLTWINHPNEDSPLVNPATDGLLPIHIGWTVSTDSGDTWQPLSEIGVAPLVQPCGNGPIWRLPNGRLIASFECYKPWDDVTPWSSRSGIVWSDNDGRNWDGGPVVVAYDPAHVLNFWDQNIQPLANGSLLNLIWVDDRNHPGASYIHRSLSRDYGQTWTPPAPTRLQGQYSKILRLPDSRLLLFYVVRHGDSSVRVALSDDQGESWQSNDTWLLYSQKAADLAAFAKDGSGGDFSAYLQSMGQWSFGWPSAVSLGDGNVLAAYYAGQGNRSSVYVRPVRVRT